MSLDITPKLADGRQQIDAYGDGGFKVSGKVYEGSILVFPARTYSWPVKDVFHLHLEDFSFVLDKKEEIEFLVVGTGINLDSSAQALKSALKKEGIISEWMDTGAACRTFSALVIEGRLIAAALIAV